MTPIHQRGIASLLAVVLVLAALAVAACGGNGDRGGARTSASGKVANGTDVAFAEDMVTHHRSAVAMAKIARERATSGYVKNLARDIIATQTSEISVLRGLRQNLPSVAKADLGMQAGGMVMDPSMLRVASPLDREFVDMMVPHHQDAIRMARAELENGKSAELRGIARAVIKAQSREITQMNAFRTERYGGPSPAGGVPDESAGMDMEHGG